MIHRDAPQGSLLRPQPVSEDAGISFLLWKSSKGQNDTCLMVSSMTGLVTEKELHALVSGWHCIRLRGKLRL